MYGDASRTVARAFTLPPCQYYELPSLPAWVKVGRLANVSQARQSAKGDSKC